MAINKKLIHFKTFETFNSLKLSANEENTKYTLGVNGEVQDGAPDILYQSIVWIKDTQKQWTHGQVYDSVNYDSEITWQELKDLKDNSQLVPGRKYRMIDYETTTGAENTLAAEHIFDLILTALDEKTLDEKCSAIQSERDIEGYFSNNNLSAWEVWYTIDNDVKYKLALLGGIKIDVDLEPLLPGMNIGIKLVALLNETIESDNITYFKWGVINIETLSFFILTTTDNPSVNDLAYIWVEGMEKVDTSITVPIINVINNLKSGKGIIYRLIDEFRNDIPYDFKNIKFLRKIKLIDTDELTLDESGIEYYFYTFSHIDHETYGISDLSNTNPFNCCKNNVIQNSSWNNVFITPVAPTLGDICHNNFISIDCFNNTFDFRCCDNELGSRCNNNVFGKSIGFNILKGDCSNNIFEMRCSRITLNNKCNNNFFRGSSDILLQPYCDNNSFRVSSIVTFDWSCRDNTLENATDVVLGYSCIENIIKGNLVKFGAKCSYNKISLLTSRILFKDECCYNILGSHCDSISLGYQVWNVKLGEFDVNIYAELISILRSSSNLNITAPQNGPIKNIQHYNIETFSAANLVLERDSKKTTYIRVDSSGNIMQFTDADIYNKQDGLISGTNIKTLNGESILGQGDITLNTSINWSVLEPVKNYMRFVAVEDSQINLTTMNMTTGEADNSVDLKHSKDGLTWTQYDFNPIPLAAGETLYLKGNNENGFCYLNEETGEERVCSFGDLSKIGIPTTTPSTGKFECHGNIMSLLYGDDFENKDTIPNAGCFAYTLAFTPITTAPELPATTLAGACYSYMFCYCTSLTTAPELPATTLADSCYSCMFNGCTSLNHITMLATDISAKYCFEDWVYGVSSTGTFIKHPDMDSLPTGSDGIPNGWTVEDAVIS